MKRSRLLSILLCVALVLSIAGVFSGCSDTAKDDGSASGDQKLTIWINGSDSYIGPEEQEAAQEDWYIYQCVARFEKANPGVDVEIIVQADSSAAQQLFKAAAVAGTAPDIANLWTGQNVFALKDVILDITDMIPQEDKDNIIGWDSVTTSDGNVLGYPTADNQVCFFLYNKQIIEECGLDFEENPPTTIDEFNAACQTITDKGYQAIASDESFPWFYCYLGAYWWLQQSGMDTIMSDCYGDTKFVDDQGLISSLDYYRSLLTNGYLNTDAVTSTDSWTKFCQGDVALMPEVSAVIADAEDALGAENVGVLAPPDFDGSQITGGTIGGPGQCLVISKDCDNPELALKFLSFIDSKAEMLELLKFQQIIPTRTDITVDELNYTEGSASAKLYALSAKVQYWVDNSLTSDVVQDFYNLLPQVLSGQMTPASFAADLDSCVQ